MSTGPVRMKMRRCCEIAGSATPTTTSASRPVDCLVCCWTASLGGVFHIHLEGQAVLDLEQTHHAVADAVEVREELDDLGLELEIREISFGTGSIVPAELDLADCGGRFEHRFAVLETEVFDAPEVDGLQAKQQLSPCTSSL